MPMRILLLEDDQALRKLAGFVLRKSGYDVEEAVNGLEGLSALEHAHFDLLVVDLMMPVMDGLGFLRTIRVKRGDQTPALVLTSMDSPTAEPEILAAGANAVALKPIAHAELVNCVRNLLPS